MRRERMLAPILIAGLVALLTPVEECGAYSPGPSFTGLSNYEMAKKAGDIVLAEATKAEDREEFKLMKLIHFKVLKSLKGVCKDKTLWIWGRTKHYRGRSRKGDFRSARPGTYAGSGRAHGYKLGRFYLLFVKRETVKVGRLVPKECKVGDKMWRVGLRALSRDREEVDKAGSPWVTAVEHYVRIARIGDYEEEKAALRELQRLTAAGEDPDKYPPGLASDVDRHFATVSPMKSYADLMTFYNAAKDDYARSPILYSLAQAFHKQAFGVIREYLERGCCDSAFVDYLKTVDDPERVDVLAAQYAKPINKRRRLEIAEALAEIAGDADKETMLKLLEGADLNENAGNAIGRWFVKHPSARATALIRKKVGRDYKRNTRGSMLLARLGDEGVVDWAAKQALTAPADEESKSMLPIYLIARSPLLKADAAVGKLIERGEMKKLTSVVYGLTSEDAGGNPNRWMRLREIVNIEKKSSNLIHALKSNLGYIYEQALSSRKQED